ncbi:MAG: AMP-binding protein [Deltaproteobacteria bacterium]|nr:AMP-binding protein [Deltaproteobacteria bacterium]
MMVCDFLLRSAGRCPDKEAIVAAGRRITYRELADAARGVAGWLAAAGLQPGDRVGILLDDPVDYVSCYFGALLSGGVVVALNTQTSARTLGGILNDCGVSRLFTHRKLWKYVGPILSTTPALRRLAVAGGTSGLEGAPAFVASLEEVLREKLVPNSRFRVPCPDSELGTRNSELRTWNPEDLAQIIYTSGTTGEPKGVMLRHSNLVANTASIVEYLRLTERDRVMAVLPFFYSYGNSVLLTHMAVGGTLVVNQSFLYPNVVLDQMQAERVTGFSGVPSTYALLLHRSAIRNYRFPDLRYATQAGGAMAPSLAREVREVLPGTAIYIMYGQTEASARLSYLDPGDLLRKAGSIGKAIPGVTLSVLKASGEPAGVGEVGEIVARGPNLMAGYWGQPGATAEVLGPEGLRTGDLATVDEEGYLYIVSRKSELIKSGAHRVGPKEIEDVLLEHPAVHEAAVLGVPHDILGEAIKACVVLKVAASCGEKELLRHCRKELPAYKVPQVIEFLDELPKTDTGKIRKVDLK